MIRLRDFPDAEELAQLYAEQYDHRRTGDHVIRVALSAVLGTFFVTPGRSIVDLSCGDGFIAQQISQATGCPAVMGDLAPGWPICGPIEETLAELDDEEAGLLILSETIEHVADPPGLLALARSKAIRLLLTTPDGEEPGSPNPQHIWGWTGTQMMQLLVDAGWSPLVHNSLDLRYAGFQYCFQMWACE